MFFQKSEEKDFELKKRYARQKSRLNGSKGERINGNYNKNGKIFQKNLNEVRKGDFLKIMFDNQKKGSIAKRKREAAKRLSNFYMDLSNIGKLEEN